MTREIFEVEAPYKFTMPVEKAETRPDGLFLVGLATGPEIDSQNERVHPSLIHKWANQINNGEIEVMYRDWHQKESSLADLGVVTKAWVDESNHMGIEVKLDEDHPTAVYIHKSIDKKGKKYGMSVFGKVISYADEYVDSVKRNVRTFYDATLDEVSNTTRPIYTPSLGTVLAKAVTEAAGDTPLGNEAKTETQTPEQKVEAEVKTQTTTDSGAATAPETGEAPETAAEAQTVEKAVTVDTKKDQKALDGIVKNWTALGQQLKAAGLLPDANEEAGSESKEETTVTKSETTETSTEGEQTSAPDDTVASLQKAVSGLTDVVTALAGRISDGGGSPVVLVQKSEAVDPLAEMKDVEDPIERLRLALAARHGANGGTR